jgi:hypothetical protein
MARDNMITDEILGIVQFLREAERLKNVYRTAWTSGGQPESIDQEICQNALRGKGTNRS